MIFLKIRKLVKKVSLFTGYCLFFASVWKNTKLEVDSKGRACDRGLCIFSIQIAQNSEYPIYYLATEFLLLFATIKTVFYLI